MRKRKQTRTMKWLVAVVVLFTTVVTVTADFSYSTSTGSFSGVYSDAYDDFKWYWSSYQDQKIYVAFSVPMPCILYRMVYPAGGDIYMTIYNGAVVTTATSCTYSYVVPRTNIPPTRTYNVEFLGATCTTVDEVAVYSPTRVLARGLVVVQKSTYSLTNEYGYTNLNLYYDYPTDTMVFVETDPIFTVSVAGAISSADTNIWYTPYTWGDHSTQGYATGTPLYAETETGFSTSTAARILPSHTAAWWTAYGWGDQSTQGYATGTPVYAETETGFSTSVAARVTATDTAAWWAAYGWGDHSTGSYLQASDVGTLWDDVSNAVGQDIAARAGSSTVWAVFYLQTDADAFSNAWSAKNTQVGTNINARIDSNTAVAIFATTGALAAASNYFASLAVSQAGTNINARLPSNYWMAADSTTNYLPANGSGQMYGLLDMGDNRITNSGTIHIADDESISMAGDSYIKHNGTNIIEPGSDHKLWRDWTVAGHFTVSTDLYVIGNANVGTQLSCKILVVSQEMSGAGTTNLATKKACEHYGAHVFEELGVTNRLFVGGTNNVSASPELFSDSLFVSSPPNWTLTACYTNAGHLVIDAGDDGILVNSNTCFFWQYEVYRFSVWACDSNGDGTILWDGAGYTNGSLRITTQGLYQFSFIAEDTNDPQITIFATNQMTVDTVSVKRITWGNAYCASNFTAGAYLRSSRGVLTPVVQVGNYADATTNGCAVGLYANAQDYGAALGWYAKGKGHGVGIGCEANGHDSGVAAGYLANGQSYGVAVGRDANGQSYGVAVGRYANAQSYGVAVGYQATGQSYGAAVGRSANGQSYGVAVGRDANGQSYGVAVGRYANAQTNGVAVGNSSYGWNEGVSIGNSSRGTNHAVAVGARAAASDTNIAIGFATRADGIARIGIGAYLTNAVDNSAALRGTLYLDGGTGVLWRSTCGSGSWLNYFDLLRFVETESDTNYIGVPVAGIVPYCSSNGAAGGVTFENLDGNADVGDASNQVARGSHTHTGAAIEDGSISNADLAADSVSSNNINWTTMPSGLEDGDDVGGGVTNTVVETITTNDLSAWTQATVDGSNALDTASNALPMNGGGAVTGDVDITDGNLTTRELLATPAGATSTTGLPLTIKAQKGGASGGPSVGLKGGDIWLEGGNGGDGASVGGSGGDINIRGGSPGTGSGGERGAVNFWCRQVAVDCSGTDGGIKLLSSSNRIAIGLSPSAGPEGVAIGPLASALEGDAIAVGSWANGGYQAVAVGDGANAYNRGARVGYGGNAAVYGSAVGYTVSAENGGVGMGYAAIGYNWGVGIGYLAHGGESNIAIGARSWANEYGGGAEVCRISIGNAVSNGVDNSCAVRGTLYLDGGTGLYANVTFGGGWTNQAGFEWGYDGTTCEVYAVDSAGNRTLLCSHERFAHVADSRNRYVGAGRVINLDLLAEEVAALSGNTNIIRWYTFAPSLWDDEQEVLRIKRDAEIAAWHVVASNRPAEIAAWDKMEDWERAGRDRPEPIDPKSCPKPHTVVPEPAWIRDAREEFHGPIKSAP